MTDSAVSNIEIIGYLKYVQRQFSGKDLSTPFSEKGTLVEEMKTFIEHFRNYIDNPNISDAPQLFLSMRNLLVGNKHKLNMGSINYPNLNEQAFVKMCLDILLIENLNDTEQTKFDEFVKQFYTYYVIAVLKKQPNFRLTKGIFDDINTFLRTLGSSGGSRKRRRSSPRKSKKRSSKTTSKGKKKVSKKSKGKKRKSQVKRRSRNNNNNRNHGNH